MIKKVWLCLAIIVMLTAGALPQAGRSAYVLRYTRDESYLDRFNVDTDELIESVHIPEDSGFNNFVVDESGGCYIAEYRHVGYYGRNIYYYNPRTKRVDLFLNLGNFYGPRYMVLTKDWLIVEVRGDTKRHGESGLLFIDRQNRKIINQVFIKENDPAFSQANINDVYYDGGQYLFLTSFYVLRDEDKLIRERIGFGGIFILDINTKKIIKTIEVPREYQTIDGICCIGDKIYIAALAKGGRDSHGNSISNEELLIFSLEKSSIQNKIKISGHPFKLDYDLSVNKIYIKHLNDKKPRSDVEIIDPKTDKIIGKLSIPASKMMVVVKPGKIYASYGKNNYPPPYQKPGLLVLDTKTDQIIKRFDGIYSGISEKSFVQ